jgi:UDP-N-acetylmuramoyl-L-alanyl-D-glutamate--2,6-diaminopimelate ligase
MFFEGRRAAFESALPGEFNLFNLLAAVGLLLAAGESLEDAAAAAKSCRGVAGRFELVPCGPEITAVVDYSHKPEALENALRTAKQIASGRVLVVFGCGGERDAGKRPQMGAIAQRLAERVIITSDNPRGESPLAIMAEIAAGLDGSAGAGGEVVQIEDRREAIRHALGEAKKGDLVLIAGKGSEAYQEIAGEKLPFDDREEVIAWAGEQGG